MRCDDAATTLTDLADGAEVTDGAELAHIERCLRCQAELAQHRKLRRAMVQLRLQQLDPGPDLVADVLAAVAGADAESTQRSASRHRAAYVAAATAATAAGAVLLASRSRRTRLSPTG